MLVNMALRQDRRLSSFHLPDNTFVRPRTSVVAGSLFLFNITLDFVLCFQVKFETSRAFLFLGNMFFRHSDFYWWLWMPGCAPWSSDLRGNGFLHSNNDSKILSDDCALMRLLYNAHTVRIYIIAVILFCDTYKIRAFTSVMKWTRIPAPLNLWLVLSTHRFPGELGSEIRMDPSIYWL